MGSTPVAENVHGLPCTLRKASSALNAKRAKPKAFTTKAFLINLVAPRHAGLRDVLGPVLQPSA